MIELARIPDELQKDIVWDGVKQALVDVYCGVERNRYFIDLAGSVLDDIAEKRLPIILVYFFDNSRNLVNIVPFLDPHNGPGSHPAIEDEETCMGLERENGYTGEGPQKIVRIVENITRRTHTPDGVMPHAVVVAGYKAAEDEFPPVTLAVGRIRRKALSMFPEDIQVLLEI